MKIAILGAGNVGRTLGNLWRLAGHKVEFGVRNRESESVKEAAATVGEAVRFVDFAALSKDVEVIVLCVPWVAVAETVAATGPLEGKVVIDATNPLILNWEGLNAGLTVGTSDSGGERVARFAPNAKVVKAFNTIGWELMQKPAINGQPITLPICGDSEDAKEIVTRLAADIGFDPVDVGPLKSARYIEPLAMLWIDMAVLRGFGRNFAFQLVKEE